jgi:hypothetical protein
MPANPAILDAQAERLVARHNALFSYLACHAVGGIVSDGGTTQGTGTNGTLNFDIDTTAIPEALIDGEVHALAAQTDADATGGAAVLWGATSGKSLIAAVVLSGGTANDTPAIESVMGAVATTGSEVAPSDDDIDTALGHDNWTRLCDMTIDRTADTTVAVSFDNAARYPAAIRGGHRIALAESEAEFRETSATMP